MRSSRLALGLVLILSGGFATAFKITTQSVDPVLENPADVNLVIRRGKARLGAQEFLEQELADGPEDTKVPEPTVDQAKDSRVTAPCVDAKAGQFCYQAMQWSKNVGISKHPDWYPNLTAQATMREIQECLWHRKKANCSKPCPEPTKVTVEDMSVDQLETFLDKGADGVPGLDVVRMTTTQERISQERNSSSKLETAEEVPAEEVPTPSDAVNASEATQDSGAQESTAQESNLSSEPETAQDSPASSNSLEVAEASQWGAAQDGAAQAAAEKAPAGEAATPEAQAGASVVDEEPLPLVDGASVEVQASQAPDAEGPPAADRSEAPDAEGPPAADRSEASPAGERATGEPSSALFAEQPEENVTGRAAGDVDHSGDTVKASPQAARRGPPGFHFSPAVVDRPESTTSPAEVQADALKQPVGSQPAAVVSSEPLPLVDDDSFALDPRAEMEAAEIRQSQEEMERRERKRQEQGEMQGTPPQEAPGSQVASVADVPAAVAATEVQQDPQQEASEQQEGGHYAFETDQAQGSSTTPMSEDSMMEEAEMRQSQEELERLERKRQEQGEMQGTPPPQEAPGSEVAA